MISGGNWNRFRYSLGRTFEITSLILITIDINIDMLSTNTNELRDVYLCQ